MQAFLLQNSVKTGIICSDSYAEFKPPFRLGNNHGTKHAENRDYFKNKNHQINRWFVISTGGWMFRKILSVIFAIFMFLPNAHSAEMVNVEYIHQYLNIRWGIDLPYNPELTNPRVAANMKYLLTVVDIANEYLNGDKTTDYGNSEYATLAAADTVATNTAIDTLVKAPTFTITTTPGTSSFSMIIGAAGNFTIDWGDGQSEVITDKPIGTTTYSHTYTTSGEYEIKLSGRATDYSDAATGAAVSFYRNASNTASISKISGSLGKIFPTLPDGSQPKFYQTFYRASNLTKIPADLFAGIQGAPAANMFYNTFSYTAITEIPADLFAGIQGAPAERMFDSTFYNTALTEIPANLFAGIQGAPAERMFLGTFGGTAITEIPADLFAGIRGAPAERMFDSTFYNTALTEIPANLFAGIQGPPAEYMFYMTFSNADTTEIPADLFAGIQGAPADSMFDSTFYNTALTEIPANLFAGIQGAPARGMFNATFYGSAITSIPENLFAGIQGAPAGYMFNGTFYNTAITSIPENLFAGIQGAPAEWMFGYTFSSTAITEIPADLFAGIRGAPAESMFSRTFQNCYQLQSIPENLFAGISGPAADSMFTRTFAYCRSLTGPSARTNGQYLYEIWPNVGGYMNTYEHATGLSDYDQIPFKWK